jgi:hypothetical protein
MVTYTVRRVLAAIPVLLAASMFSLLLIDISGDPVAPLRFLEPPPPEEVIASEEARLHLDRSMPERCWLWMTGIGGEGDIGLLRGEFGPSVRGPPAHQTSHEHRRGPTMYACTSCVVRRSISTRGSTTSSACVRARVGRPRPP